MMRGANQNCVLVRAQSVFPMKKNAYSYQLKGLTLNKYRVSCNIIHIFKPKTLQRLLNQRLLLAEFH